MIQLKITGVARRSSSEVGTRKFTYPEGKPRVAEQFHGAMWEEVEFQLVQEDNPTISVANVEGSAYLVGNSARLLLNDPALFGAFKIGDTIDFIPTIPVAPVPPAPEPAPVEAAPPKPVIETTAEEEPAIVIPKLF
jgi:hypothetical protein